MQRRLVHAGAWTLATGAAVTLSWFGVHTVLSSTAYDPPRALPIPSGDPADGAAPRDAAPQDSSTQRPKPPKPPASLTSSPSSSLPSSLSPSSPSPSSPSSSGVPSSAAQSGNVRSYRADGGRVVFDLGRSSATLVSATPNSGWEMQVWKQDTWIRVTFTQGERASSVFCTWHDSAPRVQRDER
ncbi:hypothetical protein [Streptomyces gobiensis]|uniref:hypothetical protein n=1 Tax=Streptomyces gobiensis TaxID=2875706 RepID=UPI001E5A839F|nr:hypothetical protein [Streptomyces gobiensis]UGY91567.1 hypothetical protein test1122_07400 [Streptomyces gobiensis]